MVRLFLGLLLICGFTSAVALSGDEAKGAPKGAVKLPPGAIKQVSGVTCGEVGGTWFGGTVTAKVYFLSFSKQATFARIAAAKLSGPAKKKALAKAVGLKKRASNATWTCQHGAGGKPPAAASAGQVSVHFSFGQAVVVGVAGGGRRGAGHPLRRVRAGSGATLVAIDSAGAAWNPIDAGSASVARAYVNSGNVFVVFSAPTTVGSESRCWLAVAEVLSGDPSCVANAQPVDFALTNSLAYAANPSIQFDSTGAAYYWTGWQLGQRYTLNRYGGGTSTVVWEAAASTLISDYQVAVDGTVIVAGAVCPPPGPVCSSQFTSRIRSGGEALISGARAEFIHQFADGNYYYGTLGSAGFPAGVFRYQSGSDTLDSAAWIGHGGSASHDLSGALCSLSGAPINARYCASPSGPGFTSGAVVRQFLDVAGSSTYAIATANAPGPAFSNNPSNGDVVMRYFPTVEEVNSVLEHFTAGVAAGPRIVIAGTDGAGRSVLSVVDGLTETLVVPLDSLTVASLAYAPSSGTVTATGTRSSDGVAVIARFSPANPARVVITPTTTTATMIAAIR